MVVHFQCLCYNVTLHLSANPSEISLQNIDDKSPLRWAKQIGWKKLYKGALSLGNIKARQDKLVKNKKLELGWCLFSCINCGADLYCIDLTSRKSNDVYLNDIPQKPLQERLKDMNNYFYSNVYQIILQEDPKAEKHLLEMPDERDQEAFKIFQSIQNNLKHALEKENKLMEERIEAFKRDQQLAFAQFQTHAYHERKLLWHKVCENLQLLPPQEGEADANPSESVTQSLIINNHKAEAAPLAANNTGIVIIEDYEETTQPKNAKSPIKSPSLTSSGIVAKQREEAEMRRLEEQAKSIKAAEITLPTNDLQTESAALFNFDEEPEKPKLEEELIEEDEPEPENFKLNRSAIKVSTDLFGTSLPISIQRRTDNPQPKAATSVKDKEVLLSEQLVGSNSPEQVDKSFDIPMSLNYRSSQSYRHNL